MSSKKSSDSQWVVQSDDSKSCEQDSGISLTQGARRLKQNQIVILKSSKETDGKAYIQMCGAYQGGLNAYLIPKKELEKALKLGFKVPGKNSSVFQNEKLSDD